jgi:hypothetical protein
MLRLDGRLTSVSALLWQELKAKSQSQHCFVVFGIWH